MSTPIHAVHTIHGSFSGIPSYYKFYNQYPGVVMDVHDRQPPGLAKAAWRVVPVSIPPSCRRLSAPQPRATAAHPVHFPQDDPFDDHHAVPVPTLQNNHLVPYQRTRLASQSCTVKLPRASHLDALVRQRTAQRLAQDREARCKAVAGILLNRVHAVGKPMRRAPPNLGVPRTYKRSRLSTMTTVDDL